MDRIIRLKNGHWEDGVHLRERKQFVSKEDESYQVLGEYGIPFR